MDIVKKYFFALSILFAFIFSASVAESIIPQPFRIGGTVTVDGSQLNQASDSGYTFVVTKQDGNDFNPEASDTDGLNGSNWYIIDIPIYDATDQQGGANPGDRLVIHVYRNGEDLIVTSPANGSITVGEAGSTQRIDLTVESPYIPPTQYQLTASVSGGNGSISPTSGTYNAGTVVTLTATPNAGYRVASWTGTSNNGSTSNTNTVTMDSNRTVTVTFEEIPPPQYTLTASVSGGNGSLSPTSGTYDEGTVVTLTATPNNGYRVASWSSTNNDNSTSNANTVTMDSNKTVTVTFIELLPVIEMFTASPSTITLGESTTLSWNIAGANSADINNGIGSVDASDGSINVSPDTTTIYTLTATNSGGSVSASLSVTVEEEVPTPQPPIADAGPDQEAYEGAVVTLSGLNSTDPDGDIVSYYWEQIAGDLVDLSDLWAPEISFTSPDVSMDGESLSFKLTVTDNDGLESWDECIVNVVWVNEPPSADAGLDQSVFSGDEVFLDASISSDVDDGIASYSWEQIDGPSVLLSGADYVQAVFLAPDVGDAGEALTFALTVRDNGNLKAVDTCVVNVESWTNSPPVADAGFDQEVNEHDMVTLDGSGSMDWDDGIRSYLWTQKAGTPIALSDTLVEKPTFYAPEVEIDGEVLTFELTVTDQGGLKSTDNCGVQVNQNLVNSSLVDLWVDSLTINIVRRGHDYLAKAYVTLLDETLSPVKEATITVSWTFNGTNPQIASTVTNGKGVAKFSSNSEKAEPGDIFTVTVTSIAKEGYSYDPASNWVTTASAIMPQTGKNR